MSKWYVIQVLSSHEKKVKKSIEDQREAKGMTPHIEEIVLPTENVSEVKHGEQKIVEKRLWPGYLLVKMTLTDDAWAFVKDVTGVIDFLGGEHPTPLSDAEVQDILRDLKEKKEKITQRHKFQVGDSVKIVDGVFVNFVGSVIEVNNEKGRVSVLVSIFGRETRVDDLEFFQVEEYTEEAETT